MHIVNTNPIKNNVLPKTMRLNQIRMSHLRIKMCIPVCFVVVHVLCCFLLAFALCFLLCYASCCMTWAVIALTRNSKPVRIFVLSSTIACLHMKVSRARMQCVSFSMTSLDWVLSLIVYLCFTYSKWLRYFFIGLRGRFERGACGKLESLRG